MKLIHIHTHYWKWELRNRKTWGRSPSTLTRLIILSHFFVVVFFNNVRTWLQLLKCDFFSSLFVLYDSEMNIFRLWTKQDVWGGKGYQHCSTFWHFTDEKTDQLIWKTINRLIVDLKKIISCSLTSLNGPHLKCFFGGISHFAVFCIAVRTQWPVQDI